MNTRFLLIIAILTLSISCSKDKESENNEAECGCYENSRAGLIDHWNQYIYAIGEVTDIDPIGICQDKKQLAEDLLVVYEGQQAAIQALENYGCTSAEVEDISDQRLRYIDILNQEITRYTECQ